MDRKLTSFNDTIEDIVGGMLSIAGISNLLGENKK